MYVRISWWYHLSERTFHYGFIVHLCVLSSPSTLLYIFFFWIALLHRRRTENIIGSGALGGLRGGDMAHASHLIFLWIYNTRIILPISTIYCRIHTFDIYLLVSIPNDSIQLDSIRFRTSQSSTFYCPKAKVFLVASIAHRPTLLSR